MTFAAVVLSTFLVQGAPSSGPLRLTSSPTRPLGTLREQAAVQQEWLRYRLDSVLPRLMRQYQVAMWVVPMREYNEDRCSGRLVSATSFFARRRTIYVFFDRGLDRGVERLALGGASQGGLYEAYHARDAIDPSIGRRPELVGQAQWDLLRRVIEERDPQTIAVDISHAHAFSDGLSAASGSSFRPHSPSGTAPASCAPKACRSSTRRSGRRRLLSAYRPAHAARLGNQSIPHSRTRSSRRARRPPTMSPVDAPTV